MRTGLQIYLILLASIITALILIITSVLLLLFRLLQQELDYDKGKIEMYSCELGEERRKLEEHPGIQLHGVIYNGLGDLLEEIVDSIVVILRMDTFL